MASSDARPIPRKNVAFRVTFGILDADGDLVTGAASLDSEVSKDGGTFADCTNEATEIATSSGMYFLDLTATEMDADTVAIIVKTSTAGAKTTAIILYPEEVGDIRCDAVQISGDTTAADNAEAFFDGTGYAGTGNTIPTVTNITNIVTANMTQISGDSGAADNLEAEYDGTGYKDYIRRNTAQAGAAGTITLDSGASATDDLYNGLIVMVISGTGLGQARLVTDYVGSTKVATITPNWTTNPSSDSVFLLLPWARIDIALWLGTIPNALISGRVDVNTQAIGNNVITASSIATDAIGSDEFAQSAADKVWSSTTRALTDKVNFALTSAEKDAISDVVWDEIASGHTVSGSFGQRFQIIRNGTAQAGAAGTVTLDAGASGSDDFYNNTIVFIMGGTGIGQSRIISDYVGSTKVATVNGNWITNPDNTSIFLILPFGSIPGASAPTAAEVADAVWDEIASGHTISGSFGQFDQIIRTGTAQAGATTSVTLDTGASAIDDFYNHNLVQIIGGTGVGQSRLMYDYTGSSKVALISPNWITNPDNTSIFLIRPFGRPYDLGTGVTVTLNNDKANYTIATDGISGLSFSQDAADKVWDTANRSLTDKAGFSLSATALANIWDHLTSLMTLTGSIGKKLADWVLGSDNKVILSNNAHTGAVIPTVSTVTDALSTINSALDASGSELSTIPSTTGSLRQKVNFLFQYFRNKRTVTATVETMFKEDASTTLGTASVSDDLITFSKGEMA